MTGQKLIRLTSSDESEVQYAFWCPGCGCLHSFTTRHPKRSGWEFNGDMERPTFSPSLLVWGSKPEKRCHLFMRAGRIEFLKDCHHDLAGHTVDLQPWPSAVD